MEKGETMPEEIQEKAAPEIKNEIVEEVVKASPDPFDSWDDIFPELAVKAEDTEQNPKEEDSVKAVALTEDEVRKIVREEIKKWVKGVTDGKYPFPKGGASEPTKYPYPSKEEMEAMSTGIQKSLDDKLAQLMIQISKIDIIEKSLADIKSENEALRKDVEIIRDQPAQIIEKSTDIPKKRKGFKSAYRVKEDGTIEFQ